jgi:predicted RNA-binding Zn-ribbon protein involved in translation (DUF1610 family)
MWNDALETRWQALAEDVFIGMREWRQQHPTATFTEIEQALDERLAGVRARMLQDVALTSAATDLPTAGDARPRCPDCGAVLEAHGQETRTVTTTYDKPVHLRRSAARCPACGRRLFPPR